MWIWLSARALSDASPDALRERRQAWLDQGGDAKVRGMSQSAQRYVVQGAEPQEVFWVLEADALEPAELIKRHFEKAWEIQIREVAPQTIGAAVART